MTSAFHELAKKKIIVVAHRGSFGGNIACNTLASYEIALRQGADMLEIDVSKTRDGVLCLLHPGAERVHLGFDGKVSEMDWQEVEKLRYVSYDRTPTNYGIMKFDDFLETFKGRCLINVDKFWDNPVDIYHALERHGMKEQALVKAGYSEKTLTVLKEVAPDIPFMPIVKNAHPHHEELLKSGIRYVGVETVFDDDANELATPEFIDRMHRDNVLVWANAILYNYKIPLCGSHSDDASLTADPGAGWGWIADHGYDFVQTDWAGMMIDYLKQTDKLYRS